MTRKWKMASVLIPLSVLLALFFVNMQKPEAPMSSVKVETEDFAVSISATGSVQPEHRIQVLPPVNGRIEKILISEGQSVEAGDTIALMSSLDRAAVVDSAREMSDQEAKKWENMYLPTPIRAPSSGRIIASNIVVGQTINQSTVLFELSDRLIIVAQVDEADIGKIKPNQKVFVKLDALPKNPFEARVKRISHQSALNNNINTFNVFLAPKNPPELMKSGMTASARFVIYEQEKTLTLPSWVAQGREQDWIEVLVRDAQGKLNAKKVRVGLSNGERIEVLENLSSGETIYYKEVQLKSKGKDGLGGLL